MSQQFNAESPSLLREEFVREIERVRFTEFRLGMRPVARQVGNFNEAQSTGLQRCEESVVDVLDFDNMFQGMRRVQNICAGVPRQLRFMRAAPDWRAEWVNIEDVHPPSGGEEGETTMTRPEIDKLPFGNQHTELVKQVKMLKITRVKELGLRRATKRRPVFGGVVAMQFGREWHRL